jgi:hypothetical protein
MRHFYALTLGIASLPGATAAGTTFMGEFGLSLKLEQAVHCLAGDAGSKQCAVVFPSNASPSRFDEFIAEQIRDKLPGSQFIRRASDTISTIRGIYSSPLDYFFGMYCCARRFLSPDTNVVDLGEVRLDPTDATANSEVRLSLTQGQIDRVNVALRNIFSDDCSVAQRVVHVSVDSAFEAVSFSFFDPADILCNIGIRLNGDIHSLNVITDWLGDRGVDFRHYNVVTGSHEHHYELELLCDLSQSDLHLYSPSTLEHLLAVSLEHCFSTAQRIHVPATLNSLSVAFKHPSPPFYGAFSEDDRFNLRAMICYSPTGVPCFKSPATWEHTSPRDHFGDLERKPGIPQKVNCPAIGPRVRATVVSGASGHMLVALHDNDAPPSFAGRLVDRLDALPQITSSTDFEAAIFRRTLRDLRFELPTRDEFNRLDDLPDEVFATESDRRFSRLGWDYVHEKYERDTFAIRGNKVLAEMLGTFLRTSQELQERVGGRENPIRILDIGPGVGALTTVCALRMNMVLWKHVQNLDVVLLDASQSVLEQNQMASEWYNGDASRAVLTELQLDVAHDRIRLAECLKSATHYQCDIAGAAIDKAIKKLGQFDILLSGFCHHHMSRTMKVRACQNMLKLAKPGAFIGVADESFSYRQFLRYHIGHKDDAVPIATESYFQNVSEHIALFGDGLEVREKKERKGNAYYAFWGERSRHSATHVQAPFVTRRRAAEIAADLAQRDSPLSLSRCRVIGDYYVHSDRLRLDLQIRLQQMRTALLGGRSASFLIWAASGGGKTFLIDELARALGDDITYLPIDCTRPKDVLTEQFDTLVALATNKKPVMCLLDECVALPDFNLCFKRVEELVRTKPNTVIVSIDSTGKSHIDLYNHLFNSPKQKARDFVNRTDPNHRFSIPAGTIDDSLVVVAGAARAKLGKQVTSIDKAGVFWLLCRNDLRTNRELARVVKSACDALSADVLREMRRLDFHHFIDPNVPDFWTFRRDFDEMMAQLDAKEILIED